MQLTPALTTDQLLNTENLILSICLDNRISSSDLDRLAGRLAQMEAVADQRTDTGKQHDYFSRN